MIIRVLYSILIVICAGYILPLPTDRFSWPANVALRYFIGSVVISLYMFLLSLIGIKFTVLSISLPFLLFLAVYAFRNFHRYRPIIARNIRIPPYSVFFWILTVLSMLLCASVFLNNQFIPIFRADAIAQWMFKAKIFFVERTIPLDILLNKVFDYRADYPLLVPLNVAWVAICLGKWQDTTARICFTAQYIGVFLVLYNALKEKVKAIPALMSTFMILSLPVLLTHVENGYTDFTFASFVLFSAIFLHKWLTENNDNDLVIAGFFIGASAWTKNDGIGLLLSMILTLLIYFFIKKPGMKYSFKMILLFTLAAAAVFMPFKLYTVLNSIGSHMIPRSDILHLLFANAGRISTIASRFSYELCCNTYQWLYFWIYVVLFAFLFRRSLYLNKYVYLLIFVLFSIMIYAFMFMITPLDLNFHLEVSLDRLLLGLAPAAGFAVFSALLGDDDA